MENHFKMSEKKFVLEQLSTALLYGSTVISSKDNQSFSYQSQIGRVIPGSHIQLEIPPGHLLNVGDALLVKEKKDGFCFSSEILQTNNEKITIKIPDLVFKKENRKFERENANLEEVKILLKMDKGHSPTLDVLLKDFSPQGLGFYIPSIHRHFFDGFRFVEINFKNKLLSGRTLYRTQSHARLPGYNGSFFQLGLIIL